MVQIFERFQIQMLEFKVFLSSEHIQVIFEQKS